MSNIKPSQYRATKNGAIELRPRFRTRKHKGFNAGSFGKPSK